MTLTELIAYLSDVAATVGGGTRVVLSADDADPSDEFVSLDRLDYGVAA